MHSLWRSQISQLSECLSLIARLRLPSQEQRLRHPAARQAGGGICRPGPEPEGQPAGHLSRDTIVDNITLYWLTGIGASAARSYWESGRAAALAAGQAPPEVSLPVGFTTFPGEIWRSPSSWVEQAYPNLTYFNEVDTGGHFAAWEEPELFSEEIRAAFRSLR